MVSYFSFFLKLHPGDVQIHYGPISQVTHLTGEKTKALLPGLPTLPLHVSFCLFFFKLANLHIKRPKSAYFYFILLEGIWLDMGVGFGF